MCVIINVGAPYDSFHQLKKQMQVKEVELRHVFNLLDSQEEGSWVKDAKKSLLDTFFSPQWVECSIQGTNKCADIQFLVGC